MQSRVHAATLILLDSIVQSSSGRISAPSLYVVLLLRRPVCYSRVRARALSLSPVTLYVWTFCGEDICVSTRFNSFVFAAEGAWPFFLYARLVRPAQLCILLMAAYTLHNYSGLLHIPLDSGAPLRPNATSLVVLQVQVHASFLPSLTPAARMLPCWRHRLQWWIDAHFERVPNLMSIKAATRTAHYLNLAQWEAKVGQKQASEYVVAVYMLSASRQHCRRHSTLDRFDLACCNRCVVFASDPPCFSSPLYPITTFLARRRPGLSWFVPGGFVL